MAKRIISLVVIDPQNDFCIATGPGGEKGALVVAGADKDMERLGKFITKNRSRIDQIQCTLDSHQQVHIAHPIFWVNSKGEHPIPFTLITVDDVKNGVWRAYDPKMQGRASVYVETLQKNGRYVLCIWPPHCLIGTWGHSIVPSVAKALYEWESDFQKVAFKVKGSNPYTEHYSAIMADVIDDQDSSTSLDADFISNLQNSDEIWIVGEALSHCVASTVTDIADNFGDDNIKKMVLLEDCSSSVTGFEKLGIEFVKKLVNRGMRVCKSTDL